MNSDRLAVLLALAKAGQWARAELDRAQSGSVSLSCADNEYLLTVLQALDEVKDFGFGQVTLTVKDGQVTHVQTARSYRVLPGGKAIDPLTSRDRDY